jgi:rhamnosyltransferase subunit B
LPPMRRTTRWWNSTEGVLGMFPEWYAPPQPDWPPNVRLTQFPLWDEPDSHPMEPELETFLAAGGRPVVFTPGTANVQAADFFATAVEVCRQVPCRGLLLTRFDEQVPARLPPSVRHQTYAPFGQLLPRAAAIVHHGGIGTLAQALRAGIPQLIVPLSHDQPDNARRLSRFGVGDCLPPAQFKVPAATAILRRLLDSDEVASACAKLAGRFEGVDPFAESCHAIEQLASAPLGQATGNRSTAT